jgi:hypothetical protein
VALFRRCFGSFFALQKKIRCKKATGFLVGPERFFRDFPAILFFVISIHISTLLQKLSTTGAHRGSSSSSSNNDTSSSSSCGSARVNEQARRTLSGKKYLKKGFQRECARANFCG